MANPQKENGFTSIANEIMEALSRTRIPGEARQVLDVVFRQSYGFGKKEVCFKPGQLSKATGLRRQNVNRALAKLVAMNVISVIKNDYTVIKNDYATRISFNKNYELWVASSKTITLKAYSKTITPVINIDSLPIKERLKKRESTVTPLVRNSKRLIPDSFSITDEMQQWFINQGFKHIEIKAATAEFIDHWRGEGKMKKDWVATWRNGMRLKEQWAIKDGRSPIVNQTIIPQEYEKAYGDERTI